MIVFIKADGTVINVTSSPFYQGSSLSGAFYLIAPYPNTHSASVRFTLADGRYTESYGMTSVSQLPIALGTIAENCTVWEIGAKTSEITAKAGEVTAQFTITHNGEIQTTSAVTFMVNLGVPSIPTANDVPTHSEWLDLLEIVNSLDQRIPNVFLKNFTVSTVVENGATCYKFTKDYSAGASANILVPVVTEQTSSIQSGLSTIDFTRSSWSSSNGKFTLTLNSGYGTNNFVAQIYIKNNNDYVLSADAVSISPSGVITVESNSRYAGRIVTTSNAVLLSGASGGGVDGTVITAAIDLYEGYDNTLIFRLLNEGFYEASPDNNSTYLVEFVVFASIQVDSGSSTHLEYKETGVLKDGVYTKANGYQKLTTYYLEVYGSYESISQASASVAMYGSSFEMYLDLFMPYADMFAYDDIKYTRASFIKL